MKFRLLHILAIAVVFMGGGLIASCSDDKDEPVLAASGLSELPESRDLPFTYENDSQTITFTAGAAWRVELENGVDWVYFSPSSGQKGKNTLKVIVAQNTADQGRAATFNLICGNDKELFTVRQPEFGGVLPEIGEGEKGTVDPATIPDYDKFFVNSEWGNTILVKAAKFSFARYKSSEHFFVFWTPEFGDDPNAVTVSASMRVDIDDLLAKAEKFFDTNINKLGMATLGQGKSMLDDYKMQIYLFYQDEWLATGSGYDDAIGALWVNPSTCQPVGSTIAHEIGHSFQYQTYADRVQKQGAPNDLKSGFRYGFVNLSSGCAYWEQCAQWQAHQDYPEEQFDYANYPVWLANCHRHFHHEFQRYASYWLQSYWVEKHGVESYGRIWRESVAPEDAIMAYTRIYNGNDYSKTREELFDYAMRMATYDIAGAREYVGDNQNRYDPNFVMNENGEYQIAYDNCPGATGFNVIPLTVPANGGVVKVNFRGLGYGEALASSDKGNIVNGDNIVQGKTTKYNAAGGAENMGWRYGFVALDGEERTYGEVGKEANGTLSFNVPAGTDYLWLVVQGSPEVYMSHEWDENEMNDPQFPYAITLEGTDLTNYKEPLQASYKESNGILSAQLNVPVSASNGDWIAGSYDVAEKAVADYFGVSAGQISNLIVQPTVGEKQTAQDGKIVVFNENADGTLSDIPTANLGYWTDKNGNAVSWGNGHVVYYEINGSIITLGKLGSEAGAVGESVTMRPVFVYTVNGETKTLKFNITYNFN